MRKLIMLLPLLALLCGCAPVPAVPAETVPAVTETNAAAAEPAAQEISCISDPGHLLTPEENAQLSAAIEELSARQMIRAALVLTQDLGGSTPEAYAAAQYAAICGAGNDGFLVLVNDATGQDLIYTEGACRNAMTDTALYIAQATPALVEGRYADGAAALLQAAQQMPEHVFDRSGALDAEQTLVLEAAAAGREKKRTVFLTKDAPEPGDGENATFLLAQYAGQLRETYDADTALVVDTVHHRCAVAGDAPDALNGEFYTIWTTGSLYEGLVHYFDAFPE